MAFLVQIKHANKRRFSTICTFDTLDEAVAYCEDRPANTTSSWRVRRNNRTVRSWPGTDDQRAIEEVIGNNKTQLQFLVGRFHVSISHLQIAKELSKALKTPPWRQLPRPLRRGFIKCIIETHNDNRELYNYVTKGKA
jgi:hypothetical protein